MPAKGTTLKCGERTSIIGKDLYKFYTESTSDPVDYKTFITVVLETNTQIKEWVLSEPSGFMLPNSLGFLAINRFKPHQRSIDAYRSKLLNKRIPHLNLHSYGYIFFINWFSHGLNTRKIKVYKFTAERKFKRSLAKRIFEGKTIYNHYDKTHFKNLFLSRFDNE